MIAAQTTTVRGVAQHEAHAVGRLHAAVEPLTDAADAAAEALIEACVANGAIRKLIDARVGDLWEAIAERSSWATVDRARYELEEIEPLRAQLALWADPALIAAYEASLEREQEATDRFAAALRASVVASARAELLGAVDATHRTLVAGWLDHAHPALTGLRAAAARNDEAANAAEARGQDDPGSPDEIAASADLQRALEALGATHAALVALLTALGVDAARAEQLVHLHTVGVADDYRPGD